MLWRNSGFEAGISISSVCGNAGRCSGLLVDMRARSAQGCRLDNLSSFADPAA
jgi:hypothetical protein